MSALRFSVITYGTEGDTRPLAGVCHALMQRGHQVRLWADRSTLGSAHALGVPAWGLAGNIQAAVAPGGALHALMNRRGDDVREMLRAVARIAQAHCADWLRTLLEEARDSDAILFSGLASYVGLAAGEALGKPAIGLGLWPISPTAEFGSPLLPPWRLPGWLNRWSHQLIRTAMWHMFRPATNAALREVLGAPPRRAVWSDYPLLYGVSPQLVAQPLDWPSHWRICGAWQAPVARALDWQPPPALTAFLAAGPRPIYVGFGSMGGFNRERLVRTLVDGVQGRRVLFWPGWSGIEAAALPANFHSLEAAPHEALFPLVSAVVHHGGAGTTHTAARAGVPSVVVPFAADQFFWADRLARAGVAARAVSQKRLSAAALARQLDFAELPATQARARALGQAMAAEDGIGQTVATLEAWLAAPRGKSSIIQAERHPMAAGA